VKKSAFQAVLPRLMHHVRAHSNGFTLIELMVVLVIIAVILMIGVPSYTVLTQRIKLKSHANELVSSAYLARSEAIKRNASMLLCTSTDGTTCTGGDDWEQGWIVMDPNDTVIKYQQSLAAGIILFDLSSSTGIDTVTFQSSGVVTPARFKLCQQTPSVGVEEKRITISATGRPRIETTTDGCP
jgi:type IV fimbrial biogenesis protein FimT